MRNARTSGRSQSPVFDGQFQAQSEMSYIQQGNG